MQGMTHREECANKHGLHEVLLHVAQLGDKLERHWWILGGVEHWSIRGTPECCQRLGGIPFD